MKIAVGSINHAKVEAVRSAFTLVWPNQVVDVVAQSVPSGISDQPMSDGEAVKGARNRAINAASAVDSDFGVGLEGGLQKIDGKWFDSGWAVVIDGNRHEGIGTTLRMPVPPPMMRMIEGGLELEQACDKTFKRLHPKSDIGFFGVMTNGHLDRTGPYRDAVIAALSVFLHLDIWYPPLPGVGDYKPYGTAQSSSAMPANKSIHP